ncbi:MAG: ABC transporter ATP-binding protein [Clostridia bacterium]|nr:ABC transporter ATP-binding protein [Clostridia bacterium]
MLKKLLPCTKGYRLTSALASLFVVGETIMEVFIPFLMMKIVDIGIAGRDMDYVLRIGGLMVTVCLASLVCGTLSGRFAAVAATGFAKNVRGRVFHHMQGFSFANIDRFAPASLITRLTIDVNNTQLAYMMVIRMMVRSPVMMIAATIMAVNINARLSLVFVVAIPLMALALFLIMRAAYPRFGRMLEKYDAMNAEVREKLTAIRVIKAFVREDYEYGNFVNAASALRNFQIKAEKIVILNMPLMMTAMFACIIAVLWFGGQQIIFGAMQAGELFSFITYVSQILISLMMFSMAFITLVISWASIKRITEVLDEKPDIADSDGSAAAPQIKDGGLRFEHVSFSYTKDKDRLNLHDIDFEIKPGQTVGIIGGTGSAKTTLVQLIPRLYDVDEGRVLVGGHDVRDYRLSDLRDAVAMVLQENLLFSGTIAENLRWGDARATDEQMIAAAKVAQAHDFIVAMPEGYDTLLGQAGVNLSGGQKQRLTIARALLKTPKIIILDDSTSAVDTATDARLRAAFRSELQGVTTIIIAQRIASVMDADHIIVLDEGRIAAQGSHQQLLDEGGIYAEVFHSQSKGVS